MLTDSWLKSSPDVVPVWPDPAEAAGIISGPQTRPRWDQALATRCASSPRRRPCCGVSCHVSRGGDSGPLGRCCGTLRVVCAAGGILPLFLLLPGTPDGDPGQMLGATLGDIFSLRDITLHVVEAEGMGVTWKRDRRDSGAWLASARVCAISCVQRCSRTDLPSEIIFFLKYVV